jgi:hypothetical protein
MSMYVDADHGFRGLWPSKLLSSPILFFIRLEIVSRDLLNDITMLQCAVHPESDACIPSTGN